MAATASATVKAKARSAPRRPKLVRPDRAARSAVLSDAGPSLPPTRPVVTESSLFLADMDRRALDVAAEINLIDATEARAQADFGERVAAEQARYTRWLEDETGKRHAEHEGQMMRREELQRVYDGCTAALEAARAAPAPQPEQQGSTA